MSVKKLTFKDALDSLKSLAGAGTGIGVASPLALYFVKVAPPLLPETALLVPMLAIGIFFTAFRRENRDDNIRLIKECFLLFAICLILYVSLFNFSTIAPPEQSGITDRYQIGFGKEDWSLTEEGKKVKTASPSATIQQWMLDDALFREGGPQVLWTDSSIYLAGCGLLTLFLLIFTLWNFAWGLIALEHALHKQAP